MLKSFFIKRDGRQCEQNCFFLVMIHENKNSKEKTQKNIYIKKCRKISNGWLVGWILWHINLFRLFNAKSIFIQIILFQTIPFNMCTQFNCQKHFYFKLFNLVEQF